MAIYESYHNSTEGSSWGGAISSYVHFDIRNYVTVAWSIGGNVSAGDYIAWMTRYDYDGETSLGTFSTYQVGSSGFIDGHEGKFSIDITFVNDDTLEPTEDFILTTTATTYDWLGGVFANTGITHVAVLDAPALPELTYGEKVKNVLNNNDKSKSVADVVANVNDVKRAILELAKLGSKDLTDKEAHALFSGLSEKFGKLLTAANITFSTNSILDNWEKEMQAAKGDLNEDRLKLIATVHATAEFFDLALSLLAVAAPEAVGALLLGLGVVSTAPGLTVILGGLAAGVAYQYLSPYVKEAITDLLLDSYNNQKNDAPSTKYIQILNDEVITTGSKVDDIFEVSSVGTKIIEKINGGFDTVFASVNFKLGSNFEALTLIDRAKIATGNDQNNYIYGNAENNKLIGLSGSDELSGGDGSDVIVGGLGADTLRGGSGNDTFIFLTVADSKINAKGRDTIEDFTSGDKINLHAIDANTTMKGNQDFSFIGKSGFHNKAGELRYEKFGANTFIYGDVNGDGRADFAIKLDDVLILNKGFFIV